MIVGVSALARPMVVEQTLSRDTMITLVATLTLLLSMYVGTRNTLTRKKGTLFIAMYCLYVWMLIARG